MTKIINLDELAGPEAVEIVLKGKTHPLKVATVQSFLANMKDLESLQLTSTAEEQTEVGLRIIKRAFPSIEDEDLRGLTLFQVNKLRDLARVANDEVQEIEGGAAAEGNARAAS